ncbi:MAG: hypothetical protein PHX51_07710 [Clostridia bacterium]|nr:hypothetical protein [Clostridia bacterium]
MFSIESSHVKFRICNSKRSDGIINIYASNQENSTYAFAVSDGELVVDPIKLTASQLGNVTGTVGGMYVEKNGKLTVNGGSFTVLDNAIRQEGGDITLNGGMFKNTVSDTVLSFTSNGTLMIYQAQTTSPNGEKAINVRGNGLVSSRC